MILQALVDYYEELLKEGKTVPNGWCRAKVAFALNLAEDGSLKNVISLKEEREMGKKTAWISSERTVPQMVSRSSGVSANFLCDNSKYILGTDAEGNGGRVQDCFEAAKQRHLGILKDVHSTAAEAVKNFFQTWKPEEAKENPKLQELWDEITDGSNLIFLTDEKECQDAAEAVKNFFQTWKPEEAKENPKLQELWDEITDGSNLIFLTDEKECQEDEGIQNAWNQQILEEESEAEGVCLVTGKRADIARIHTAIKGVQGAQSSGAALVSFNAPAFESYGKTQNYNAPVGKYAAFAYTTALNYLLSQKAHSSQKKYAMQLGDTTVVFWAEGGEELYQDVFGWGMEMPVDNQKEIQGILKSAAKGEPVPVGNLELDLNRKFYILGLAPNAARLSVRFFYQDHFGSLLEHINAHYMRLQMVKPVWENREYLGIWALLQETVNQNAKEKKPVANMAAAVIRAILAGDRYPTSLYTNLLIRIRSEQGKMTWGRASIIKAYLMRNYGWKEGGEFVKVNEETKDRAYVLGRIFSVLEAIQEEANPGINTTIRDRYFNSACTTPASVFPVLLRLKNSHIRKLDHIGLKVKYEKTLTELMGKLSDYPTRLTLEEQGMFMLGYYHEAQKRYTKKTNY